MTSVTAIQGVGSVIARKLAKAGAGSIQSLLSKGATRKGRRELQASTRISQKLILEWVNHADLFRVKGIAGQYAELLEESGVDSVPELAKRKAEILTEKMMAVNERKNLVNRPPSAKEVKRWIASAKRMKRVVQY